MKSSHFPPSITTTEEWLLNCCSFFRVPHVGQKQFFFKGDLKERKKECPFL